MQLHQLAQVAKTPGAIIELLGETIGNILQDHPKKPVSEAFSGKFYEILYPEYPKWKHLVPENPTEEQLDAAWERIFGKPIRKCDIIEGIYSAESVGCLGFRVDGKHNGGTFWEATESPLLQMKTGGCFFYDGGCFRSYTDDDKIYYSIDKETGLPANWENYVFPVNVIRNFAYTSGNGGNHSDPKINTIIKTILGDPCIYKEVRNR